jgi:hypothetical protein
MELLLKNVNKEGFLQISELATRLGIIVEKQIDDITPDNFSSSDDLKQAVSEIKAFERGKTKLQDTRELINEL